MTTDRRARGDAAEALALRHLLDRGLVLVARNWSCPSGELDLVMRDGDTLVVVEVRSRADTAHGRPEETVGTAKRRRLVRATQRFVQEHPAEDRAIRFDVVAIVDAAGGPELDWLRGAFDV